MKSGSKDTLADFPALTVAQIASALGKRPTSVRKLLIQYPATAKTVVAGKVVAAWHLGALPEDLHLALQSTARTGGFDSIRTMFSANAPHWQPAIPLAEISDECLNAAAKLREALLPTLRRGMLATTQAEVTKDGINDFERVFGHRISSSSLYRLVARTARRDSGLNSYERLELYLPERPQRRQSTPPPETMFSSILDVINSGTMETIQGDKMVTVSNAERVWRRAFEILKEIGDQKKNARKLRDFLFIHAPSLAPTRAALKKIFHRRRAAWKSGKPFDGRAKNKSDVGDITRQIRDLKWFIPAGRFFYLLTNRTHNSGSLPEAIKCVLSLPAVPTGWPDDLRRNLLKKLELEELPTCPAPLREEILQREKNYQPLVPESIARQIRVNAAIVGYFRSPREWSLNNLSAPGSQRRRFNMEAGRREAMAPGDWFGGDDATPGIAVCVPCEGIETPTSQKFGVSLGRFQWLAYHDCRTDKILAWDYVVRPRGSYRSEDILNGMGAVLRTHGIPRGGFQFEGGTFAAKLVKQAIKSLGCEHWQAHSPRTKSIESVFNRVWTRLAVQFPHADMGRYRNENEANCKLYEACKAGHKDPRRYFPKIALLMEAFDEIVKAHNAKPIDSSQYGRWVPDDFFDRATKEKPLRPFSPEMEWMLAPYSVERTVRGCLVGCKVPLFEGFSVPFEFGADWLPAHHGKKVRLHFNPRQPKCVAKVVLLENSGERKAGDVLGNAALVSETAQQIRYILEWGTDDQQAGFVAKQKAAHFVWRETRGVGTGGRVEYSSSEERDGLATTRIVQRGKTPEVAPGETAASRLVESLGDRAELAAVDRAECADRRAHRRAELAELRTETENSFI